MGYVVVIYKNLEEAKLNSSQEKKIDYDHIMAVLDNRRNLTPPKISLFPPRVRCPYCGQKINKTWYPNEHNLDTGRGFYYYCSCGWEYASPGGILTI
jgi:hypothetical protein